MDGFLWKIITMYIKNGESKQDKENVPFPLKRLLRGGIEMELRKELKEKVEKATSAEEAKQILEEAGIILNDAELDQVAGGTWRRLPQ